MPQPVAEEADAAAMEEAAAAAKRWPGWPGDSVLRLVVPVLKVGSIIGRKGELIKRLVEETKARVRILEGPVGATERIVSSATLLKIDDGFMSSLTRRDVNKFKIRMLCTVNY